MLQIRDLHKSYREPDGTALPILDIKEFHVADSEQAVLMGRSGSGKTTLLHVIAGISRPDSGSVTIDGTDIVRLSEAGRDRFRADKIGYVFQTFNLLPGFSALENVLLGMSFAGSKTDPARARDLLDRVGLKHRLSHRPAALSVGEQQRVAVARRWPTGRSYCWPTSPRPTSTRAINSRSSTWCGKRAAKRVSRC